MIIVASSLQISWRCIRYFLLVFKCFVFLLEAVPFCPEDTQKRVIFVNTRYSGLYIPVQDPFGNLNNMKIYRTEIAWVIFLVLFLNLAELAPIERERQRMSTTWNQCEWKPETYKGQLD